MSTPPPAPVDPAVAAVEEAIRKLTEEQWAEVRERLNLCNRCGLIGGGMYCCYDTGPNG